MQEVGGCDVEGIPTGKKYENFLVLRFSLFLTRVACLLIAIAALHFVSHSFLTAGKFQKEKLSHLVFNGNFHNRSKVVLLKIHYCSDKFHPTSNQSTILGFLGPGKMKQIQNIQFFK